ncbi:hypothetical protein HanIR_Chr17g0846521 [Helianthus annuus]|nr:hypothetical protein HanIR_Chr17g0846521 [Helianthus annuus]
MDLKTNQQLLLEPPPSFVDSSCNSHTQKQTAINTLTNQTSSSYKKQGNPNL